MCYTNKIALENSVYDYKYNKTVYFPYGQGNNETFDGAIKKAFEYVKSLPPYVSWIIYGDINHRLRGDGTVYLEAFQRTDCSLNTSNESEKHAMWTLWSRSSFNEIYGEYKPLITGSQGCQYYSTAEVYDFRDEKVIHYKELYDVPYVGKQAYDLHHAFYKNLEYEQVEEKQKWFRELDDESKEVFVYYLLNEDYTFEELQTNFDNEDWCKENYKVYEHDYPLFDITPSNDFSYWKDLGEELVEDDRLFADIEYTNSFGNKVYKYPELVEYFNSGEYAWDVVHSQSDEYDFTIIQYPTIYENNYCTNNSCAVRIWNKKKED